ncbi:hypothetical protein GC170_16240 [bacterium]|nr:hypothetical protein [bacterium]
MTTILLRRDFWLEWVCLIPLAAIMLIGGVAFGGNVWWFRPLAITGVGLSIGGGLLRLGWRRDRLFLSSPLLFLGIAAMCWAAAQCVPLPHGIVERFAPVSEAAYARDRVPVAEAIALADPAETASNPPLGSRIPVSLNRAETVRRALWLALGLGVFWFAGMWTDRSSKLIVVCGFVVALGAVHSAILTLQLLDGSEGFYGHFTPHQRMFLGPGMVDLTNAPHRSELTTIEGLASDGGLWTIERPTEVEMIGILPGGLVTFGCLQMMALPACFGAMCYLCQRRGSRFSVRERLQDRGVSVLFCVMAVAGMISAALVGLAVPLWVVSAIALGLAVAFFFAIRSDLEWWVPVSLGLVFASAYFAGHAVFADWTVADDSSFQRYWREPDDLSGFLRENLEIWKKSGWTGIGLGAYSLVAPYVKTTSAVSSNAVSSAISGILELGVVALAVFALAYGWIAFRLVRGFRHVGYEQRCLLGMTLGTSAALLTGFWVSPGWDNPLLLMVACALLGITDRVLCGASDLFMESWDEG